MNVCKRDMLYKLEQHPDANLYKHLGSPPQRQNHLHIDPINPSILYKVYKHKRCHALGSILTVICRDLKNPCNQRCSKNLCLNIVSLFSTNNDTSEEFPGLRKPDSKSSSHKNCIWRVHVTLLTPHDANLYKHLGSPPQRQNHLRIDPINPRLGFFRF